MSRRGRAGRVRPTLVSTAGGPLDRSRRDRGVPRPPRFANAASHRRMSAIRHAALLTTALAVPPSRLRDQGPPPDGGAGRRRPGLGDREGDLSAGEGGTPCSDTTYCALSTDDIEADHGALWAPRRRRRRRGRARQPCAVPARPVCGACPAAGILDAGKDWPPTGVLVGEGTRTNLRSTHESQTAHCRHRSRRRARRRRPSRHGIRRRRKRRSWVLARQHARSAPSRRGGADRSPIRSRPIRPRRGATVDRVTAADSRLAATRALKPRVCMRLGARREIAATREILALARPIFGASLESSASAASVSWRRCASRRRQSERLHRAPSRVPVPKAAGKHRNCGKPHRDHPHP
jgi:hypothetical protein